MDEAHAFFLILFGGFALSLAFIWVGNLLIERLYLKRQREMLKRQREMDDEWMATAVVLLRQRTKEINELIERE